MITNRQINRAYQRRCKAFNIWQKQFNTIPRFENEVKKGIKLHKYYIQANKEWHDLCLLKQLELQEEK
jgi:hypothetical protein